MNYTPLDVASFKKKGEMEHASHESFDINMIFLSLITITLIVLAVLIFFLIQKKLQELGMSSFFA
jgi:hypothetical protein